jgi:predicted NBD/HSP70 family sugar kinase
MLHQVGFGVKFIKDYNELNVLRFIKNHEPVSRAEIAKKYHISKAAVSDIIARLILQGYVAEIGVGDSTSRGGRRPVLLKFNQKAGYVIGIEIKRTVARVALSDLDANLQEQAEVEYPAGSSMNTVLDKIFPIIHRYREIPWVKKARPIGIGVGVPGLIDYKAGFIKVSDTLKNWVGVPIRDVIEREFKTQVILENDVKTLTLGECLFGRGRDFSNLVYLWIGDGIGAGIIVNGQLLRGITASAGEVGYDELGFFVRDKENFPLLYQGQKDFADILSNKLLVEAANRALEDGYTSTMKKDKIDLHTITRAAEDGDELAVNLLREFGTLLGILAINLVNTLNMELLIIGGKILLNSDILLEYVKEKVHNDLLNAPAEAVRIVSANLKERGGVMGAAGLVLEDLFYQDTINVLKYRDIFK